MPLHCAVVWILFGPYATFPIGCRLFGHTRHSPPNSVCGERGTRSQPRWPSVANQRAACNRLLQAPFSESANPAHRVRRRPRGSDSVARCPCGSTGRRTNWNRVLDPGRSAWQTLPKPALPFPDTPQGPPRQDTSRGMSEASCGPCRGQGTNPFGLRDAVAGFPEIILAFAVNNGHNIRRICGDYDLYP